MPSSSDRPLHAPDPDADEHEQLGDDDAGDGLSRLSRLNVWLLAASLVSLCAALYLSPVGTGVRDEVNDSVRAVVPGLEDRGAVVDRAVPEPSRYPSPAKASADSGTEARGAPGAPGATDGAPTGRAVRSSATGLTLGGVAGTGRSGDGAGGGTGDSDGTRSPTGVLRPPLSGGPSPSGGPTQASPPQARTQCWEFAWQQDAQVVYLANLSDPHGLDAEPGPNDGDGLACSDLEVDPDRPPSTPAGAYAAPKPTVATKRVLVHPDQDYFGFSQSGVPGDTRMLTGLARRAGKAPSTVGWFSAFDDDYRGDLVEKSWNHGALPVVTWMPAAADSRTSYSLTSILNGTHDRYLRRYAGAVVRQGLPVALRFAHEMNGNWYGWSAGRTDYNNTPEKFVAAWRHVWQVFDDVGATDNVIWLWSPSRVDNLRPTPTNGLTTMAETYPGDAYVDWVGASVYLRTASVGPSFEASFGRTVAALTSVTDKPMFFAETAAVQTDRGSDQTPVKTAWTRNVLAEFARDERLVGFLWFNDVAASVVNGVEVTNDWRFDANRATAAAFRQAVGTSEFAGGVLPD